VTAQEFTAICLDGSAAEGVDAMDSEQLSSGSLAGTSIAISVAQSADLGYRGFSELHFREILGELTQLIVHTGGRIVYGGDLRRDGYTRYLMEWLRANEEPGRQLVSYLAWNVHRNLELSDIEGARDEVGGFGEVICLGPDGEVVDPSVARGEAAVPVTDPEVVSRSLTAMRRRVAEHTAARVSLGGKRAGFSGSLPGIVEENLLSLQCGRPVYLLSAFGGATTDVAVALGVGGGEVSCLIDDDGTLPDPRLVEGRARLQELAASPVWPGLSNGLTAQENAQLAIADYPPQIAALVGRGLWRMRQRGQLPH
jgi:hypothetical protein